LLELPQPPARLAAREGRGRGRQAGRLGGPPDPAPEGDRAGPDQLERRAAGPPTHDDETDATAGFTCQYWYAYCRRAADLSPSPALTPSGNRSGRMSLTSS